MSSPSLTRFAWLSIAAAGVTILLKLVAFLLTGSAGLFSDALESVVNLVAAVAALTALHISERPPDENHAYGHTKIEYFSSITEGVLICVAAISIAYFATMRIIWPRPIDTSFTAIGITIIASAINYLVAQSLFKAGKSHRSITLEADAKHLLADVWTSVGVIVAVFLVMITGWTILDPIIALLVAANIIVSGFHLIKESALGFMDTAVAPHELQQIKTILAAECPKPVTWHGLRTRQSASRRFISVHILVPGTWSVRKGHNLLEHIEKSIHREMDKVTVFTHLEPLEDPRSMDDQGIDR